MEPPGSEKPSKENIPPRLDPRELASPSPFGEIAGSLPRFEALALSQRQSGVGVEAGGVSLDQAEVKA
jgi:hypothetical protein